MCVPVASGEDVFEGLVGLRVGAVLCEADGLLHDGIGLPHVRNPAILEITTPMVCLCFLDAPVEYDALDGKPVKVLFMPLSPDVRIHLHLLSRISFALRDAKFRALLAAEARRDEILEAARALEPAPAD